MSQRTWLVTVSLVVGLAAATFAWWYFRPSPTDWGTFAQFLAALASLAAFSYAFYTTTHEIEGREQADERADRADARARALQEAAEDQRQREYASQVSWWTEKCAHPYDTRLPEGEDDETTEARHQVPTDQLEHHRPYLRGEWEGGSGWPEDRRGDRVKLNNVLLVDLHIRNTGPHPLYACGVKSERDEPHFIGKITEPQDVFLERIIQSAGLGSTGWRVFGEIDAGAMVEWIQFTDARGDTWQLDRQQMLRGPLPEDSRLGYKSP